MPTGGVGASSPSWTPLQVAEKLARSAPRPVIVKTDGQHESALSTLVLAQILPGLLGAQAHTNGKEPVES